MAPRVGLEGNDFAGMVLPACRSDRRRRKRQMSISGEGLYLLTDRDILRDKIEIAITIENVQRQSEGKKLKVIVERERSIQVIPGPRFIFTEANEIKSIIKGGRSYGPDGNQSRRAPRNAGGRYEVGQKKGS
jgi:hypothetical protein